jgi:hypothetical protein
MRNTSDVTGNKPIAVFLQCISDVSAINPLVAFYDIHGRKSEVLFFCFVSDTTRDYLFIIIIIIIGQWPRIERDGENSERLMSSSGL